MTIYTNATWLQPLAVPVDATARRLHIIALSMYALKVPVGEAEELAQLADSTALHRLQGRVKGGAALSLASIHIRLVRFRTLRIHGSRWEERIWLALQSILLALVLLPWP